MKRVTIGPKAQMPSEVFTSATDRFEPPARERVDGHGREQDQTRDELLDARRVAEEAHPVRQARDHERAVDGHLRMAAAAEEADASDHRSGDGVEEERA